VAGGESLRLSLTPLLAEKVNGVWRHDTLESFTV
jgi:hypothetical protein